MSSPHEPDPGMERAMGPGPVRAGAQRTVAGERSTAAVHRVRSLESRVSNLLALGLICVLGFALLVWYYSAALRRPARVAEGARALAAGRAQAEMPLPPLGPMERLATAASPHGSATQGPMGPVQGTPAGGSLEGSAPRREPAAPPQSLRLAALPMRAGPGNALPYSMTDVPPYVLNASMPVPPGGPAAPAPRETAFERRLSGPAFVRLSDSGGTSAPQAAPGPPAAIQTSGSPGSASSPAPASGAQGGDLAQLLTPLPTPAVSARVLPTQSLLLPKGAFIDCTLETAIDSTLPGMTTCITATDTFSADGKVVLLERGSKLVGETHGDVEQGAARVFVLWTEARTPTGVVIPLASPGTDELGRSGLPGQVNRHFWARFGAAILISIIDTGAEAAMASGNGAIIYDPSATQDVTSGVLRETLRVPPTVVKSQGDRIQVLVARDLDFRSVYELRTGADRR